MSSWHGLLSPPQHLMIDSPDTAPPATVALATPRTRRLFLRDSAFAALVAGAAPACRGPAAAAPGERWDGLVKCTNPGTWAFHCHILPHAESEQGMFGMVTVLIVKPKPVVA